jgi:DnaK suppressor protein
MGGDFPRAPGSPPRPEAASDTRERLERERASAVRRLRELGLGADGEPSAPGGGDAVLEAGDAAQANQRRDMGVVDRERLARRIKQLTAALARLAQGTYGRCEVCEGDIEPPRLAALPEAAACRGCQEDLERDGATSAAANSPPRGYRRR